MTCLLVLKQFSIQQGLKLTYFPESFFRSADSNIFFTDWRIERGNVTLIYLFLQTIRRNKDLRGLPCRESQ